MIAAHALMLDEQARKVTEAGFKKFQESQDHQLDHLRQDSWDVVQRWEERLSDLPRMKKGMLELCNISIGWQDQLALESATIQAFLRTGMDERATRVLELPAIRAMIPHHKEAYASEARRKNITQMLESLSRNKTVLKECSEKVVGKKACVVAAVEPLLQQLTQLTEAIAAAGEEVGPTKEQTTLLQQLNEKITKLELGFEKSDEVEELDDISTAIMKTFMSMDGVLNEEEAVVTRVVAEETFFNTVLAAQKKKTEAEDMKKKMLYMFENNSAEVGRAACDAAVGIMAKICVEPENREYRNINSTSRSSPIQAIFKARGGFDVVNGLGFYQGAGVWTLPSDISVHNLQVGCEYMCVLLGIPDRILLLKVQANQGQSIAQDLLKQMMTSEDATNATTVEDQQDALRDAADNMHQLDNSKEDGNHGEDWENRDGEDDEMMDVIRLKPPEDSAEEKALTQLFKKLDKDDGGSLSADEMIVAMHEFNIDADRPSAARLLVEVEAYGEEGMRLEAFRKSMMALLLEPVEEEDPFEGMDEEQVARLKKMLQSMFNGQMAHGWEQWKNHVDRQQISRTGALENYKRVCQVLTISPSISTLFLRFLQSRGEDRIDLSNRGMSPLAFKAFACGMTGWAPDFVNIEKMSKVPKDFVLANPEETFSVRCDPCVNVFELRKLGACVPLCKLDMSNNAGGPESARDLKPVLLNSFGCLTQFNLSGNNIGEEGGQFISEALLASNGPPLVRLELARNKMGDVGTAAVVKSLADSERIHSLTYLDLSGNDCGYEAAVELGRYVANAGCRILHLDIGWNLLRNDAAGQVFRGLVHNVTVMYLNVSWNGVDVASCSAIGEALKSACVLRELDLNHTNISGEGALLIAGGLKKNKHLRTIILDSNNIKQTGARALVKASLASQAHVDENGTERVIQMVDCNLQSVDSTSFNKAEPAGKYSLDLDDASDRTTFVELLALAYKGKVEITVAPPPEHHTHIPTHTHTHTHTHTYTQSNTHTHTRTEHKFS